MSDVPLTFAYRIVGEDNLDAIQPLWVKLRAYHSPLLSRFPEAMPPFAFEARKQELLAKAAAGKMRVELVSLASNAADIAYCVSTVSTDGRGEVDSMFVEERFRGRGIGSELVWHALAWLEGMEALSKVVTVAHANDEALVFYRRFGFHPRTVLLQQSHDNAA
jgi:GNAT superfamily N-acetyltransferase